MDPLERSRPASLSVDGHRLTEYQPAAEPPATLTPETLAQALRSAAPRRLVVEIPEGFAATVSLFPYTEQLEPDEDTDGS